MSSAPPRRDLTGKTVAIVAMGESNQDYILACSVRGGRRAVAHETWAINAMAGVIACDLVVSMDWVESYVVAHVDEKLARNHADISWLTSPYGPPILSVEPDAKIAPRSARFPVEEVIAEIGYPYLLTSCAGAIGLAMLWTAERIQLYGCDFTYPDRHIAERGRANTEFVIAMALRKGIKIDVAKSSTLLESASGTNRIYGYRKPHIAVKDGADWKVQPIEVS